ncbi:hypothetical protein JNUCC1_02316 [Lentibacillus sp. JNUCC-1]|nr:hypothetical protein [Lentibacillus sp. JNUCC-1]
MIHWLLEHYPGPLHFFFLGLILGVIPFLLQQSDARHTFKSRHVLLLIIGAVAIGSIEFLDTTEGAPLDVGTTGSYIYLFMAGFIASAAMILPGISGSMILLVIGAYSTVITGLKDFQLDVLFATGIGVAIGIVVMSRLIRFFLERYRTGTFALVIGFVIGSLVIVFPGWADDVSLMVASIAAFAIGLLGAFLLGRLEYKAEG